MKDTRLSQLDGLRGLFALMVALFHFPSDGDFSTISLLSNFMIRQGDLFVDFFFVLSGFVISLNYTNRINEKDDFIKYLKARFLRLYPLLFYTVIIYLGFELVFNLFLPHLLTNPEPISVLFLQTLNSLLFLNSTPIIDMVGMNFPSWSISSEMISYIIFGLALLWFNRSKKYAIGFILLASAAFIIYLNSYMETMKWGFVRGLVCFMTGFYTFKLYQQNKNITLNKYLEYLVPILLVSVLYIRYYYVNNIELYSLFIIPLFFGISIFVFALSNGYIVKLMCHSFFQFLGKISYSLYLNHAIVMVIFTKFIFGFLKVPVTELAVSLTIIAYLLFIVIYSYFTYIFIEVKGKKFLQNFYPFKRKESSFIVKP
ncbi:acyltransferase [Flavobacterium arcticum]|uniref:Acyltransferase n=1 Tax=Flavobacterium arcticum TaxID=1784713 RepID=A0A345H8A3_9FLAO|nr:acyltransferase [Flavobacterium arcticum]AXG72813.1 acyltransferase [Flavobacterium arcticum]KAF2510522.1 acyltransferase [Flavobacterium arcticum]